MYEHNNFKITFDPNNEMWICNQLNLKNTSYKKLINEIDSYKQKFSKYISVYYWEYKDNPIEIQLTEVNGSRGLMGIFPDKTYPMFVNPKYVFLLNEEMKQKIEIYNKNFKFIANKINHAQSGLNQLKTDMQKFNVQF